MDNKEQKSLNQIIEYRIKKIDELKNNDITPYPYKFNKEFDVSYILNHEKDLKDQRINLENLGMERFTDVYVFVINLCSENFPLQVQKHMTCNSK